MENQDKAGVVVRGGDYRSNIIDVLLRVAAFAVRLTAGIVLVVNKQTKVNAANMTAVAKWHYLSAFVYLVVANAVVCSYAALSTIITVRRKNGWWVPFIAILDVLMVAILFSADGAAAAIGLMAYQGNSHVNWNKVCNTFGKFCGQVVVAAGFSVLGSVAFILIVALTIVRLHKR